MLPLLPISVFALLFLARLERSASAREPRRDLREVFLKTATVWGVITMLIAEGLGALHRLDGPAVALSWLIAGGLLIVFRRRLGDPLAGGRILADAVRGSSITEPFMVSAMGVMVVLLGVVAIVSPPNNVDSLLYHMTRVVHWQQNASLEHYATAYQHQLFMPPWAEIAILHLRLLAGSDRFANMVQWFSLGGCLLGASAIAARLGADIRGQIASAGFALTLPMAILQATSTQNDLVVAFWLMALAYHAVDISGSRPSLGGLLLLGATLGLGLATKFTFGVFALPFMLWVAVGTGLRDGWMTAARTVGIVLGLAVLVNLGVWGRNLATYGSALGPAEAREIHQGPLFRGRPDLREILAREAQMMARNLVAPTTRTKEMVSRVLARAPALFGESYIETMSGAVWNHEDTAGNPIHFVAVALTGFGMLILARRHSGQTAAYFAVASAAGYLLLPLIVAPAIRIYSPRYQLVFFVSWAPIAGWTLCRGLSPLWGRRILLLLLALSTPWLLFNNTRPLLGAPPSVTRVGSVLASPAEDVLFAMYSGQQDEFKAVAVRMEESACSRLGLQIDSHDPEYLIWRSLGAPESGLRIEHISTYPELQRYLNGSFAPCAVLCTICLDEAEVAGLPLDRSFGRIRLYLLAAGGTPQEGHEP